MLQKLILHLNSLNEYLDLQCRIKSDYKEGSATIKAIIAQIQKETILISEHFNMYKYGEAVIRDLDIWLATGCEDKPNFKNSRDTLKSPKNGDIFFFIGPLRIANGSRASSVYKFECFLSKREEPQNDNFDYLYTTYPHPKNICQSSHLLNASSGLLNGNNLVFFPENILASDVPNKQEYAVFYFNKFYKIFQDLTIPLCSKIGLDDQYTSSKILTEDETYKARCVWGYLHDYYHHIGPRPFDEHIKIKTKWFTGLIEEVKIVDSILDYMSIFKGNFMLNKNDLKKLYILGPEGTNSELAAKTYIQEHSLLTEIILCETLELGIVEVLKNKNSALLGCVAYPDLHNLIFPYLAELVIGDLFLCDTYDMVLAKKKDTVKIEKVASHIAPSSLVNSDYSTIFCNSNADAARLCFQDKTDACVTTKRAADDLDLEIIKNYNSLPMGFSVHVHKDILKVA